MRKFVILLMFSFVGAVGCAPTTPIRRAAFVPRHTLPANHGAPIGGKGVKAFGHVNSVDLSGGDPLDLTAALADPTSVFSEVGQEGFAGLWIPKIQVGGGIYGAVSKNVEMGAHLSYTNLEWASANVIGVPEFPDTEQDRALYFGGGAIRGLVPIDDLPIVPSFGLEINYTNIPQAVYVCSDNCDPANINTNGLPRYDFERLDSESFFLPTISVGLDYAPIEYLHVIVLGGAQRNVKNIGFDPDITNLANHTLEGYYHGFVGGGVEARFGNFFMTGMLSGAFGQPEEIGFGLSGTFSTGVVFSFADDSINPVQEPGEIPAMQSSPPPTRRIQ